MADSKTNKVKGIFNKVGHDAERIGRDIGQGCARRAQDRGERSPCGSRTERQDQS